MADVEIHDLITAEDISSSDVIADQRESAGVWLTRKLTFNALGLFLNKVLNYASDLTTTAKTIIGAINEVNAKAGYTELTETLAVGSTTVVFTDNAIVGGCTVQPFVDEAFTGVSPTAQVTDGTNHTLTLTFPAQESAMPVKVRIS